MHLILSFSSLFGWLILLIDYKGNIKGWHYRPSMWQSHPEADRFPTMEVIIQRGLWWDFTLRHYYRCQVMLSVNTSNFLSKPWAISLHGPLSVCAQPVRDNITLWHCLSLAGHLQKLSLNSPWSVNSSPPSATYMHQWTGSAVVQIMACHLFGTKPLSKPMLGYCQLGP